MNEVGVVMAGAEVRQGTAGPTGRTRTLSGLGAIAGFREEESRVWRGC